MADAFESVLPHQLQSDYHFLDNAIREGLFTCSSVYVRTA